MRAKQEPRYQANPRQGAGSGTSYHHYAANPAPGFKSGHIEVGTCVTWLRYLAWFVRIYPVTGSDICRGLIYSLCTMR